MQQPSCRPVITKNPGKNKRRSELTIQRLASEVSGKAQKYNREGPRVFVPLENPVFEEELSIDMIIEAREDYFGDEVGPHFEYNVLAGRQGQVLHHNRPFHDGKGIMGNQGKNYSE